MFQSLRFRLSAIFLAAVVLAGLVSSLIAIRLFQDYTQSQTLKELQPRVARDHAVLRGAGRDQHVLGQEPREGDRRQALLHPGVRAQHPAGREGRPAAGAGRRGGHRQGARRQDPQLRVHASGPEDALRRRRQAAEARRADLRRDGGRQAEGGAARGPLHGAAPARDRLRGRRRARGRARRVPLAADHRAGARAHARGRPGRGRALRRRPLRCARRRRDRPADQELLADGRTASTRPSGWSGTS